MNTQHYQIQVSTQLGIRKGLLTWVEQDTHLDGTLELLRRKTSFSGRKLGPESYEFSGQIQTIVSCIPYHAVFTLRGGQLHGIFHMPSGDCSMTGTALQTG